MSKYNEEDVIDIIDEKPKPTQEEIEAISKAAGKAFRKAFRPSISDRIGDGIGGLLKGIGLEGIIFAIFLYLKLAGIGVVATWSWWWVTAPLWLPYAVLLGVCVLLAAIYLLVIAIRAITDRLL